MTGFPAVDVRTIGAGGGSIARVDAGGLLHVGPDSAGSVPGPVCYGRGGSEPTVTDACLVLGYLEPDYFSARLMASTSTPRRRIARSRRCRPRRSASIAGEAAEAIIARR